MFKNFAAILAVIAFGLTFYPLYSEKPPVFYAYADEYEIYLSAGSFGDNIAMATKATFSNFTGVKGESCKLTAPYAQVLEDFSATHLFSETTENGESYYAYSPKLRYKTYVKGKAVNLHYYAGKSGNRLGTPMIFGSF